MQLRILLPVLPLVLLGCSTPTTEAEAGAPEPVRTDVSPSPSEEPADPRDPAAERALAEAIDGTLGEGYTGWKVGTVFADNGTFHQAVTRRRDDGALSSFTRIRDARPEGEVEMRMPNAEELFVRPLRDHPTCWLKHDLVDDGANARTLRAFTWDPESSLPAAVRLLETAEGARFEGKTVVGTADLMTFLRATGVLERPHQQSPIRGFPDDGTVPLRFTLRKGRLAALTLLVDRIDPTAADDPRLALELRELAAAVDRVRLTFHDSGPHELAPVPERYVDYGSERPRDEIDAECAAALVDPTPDPRHGARDVRPAAYH